MSALGAEIIRTPSSAPFDHPDSHHVLAHVLAHDVPNAHVLDQVGTDCNTLMAFVRVTFHTKPTIDG